jgi:Domain of unknown function (DUF4157)
MSKLHRAHSTRETSPAPQRAKLAEAASARAASLRHLAPGATVQRAMAARHPLRPTELIAMQRTLGNRAAGAMLGRQPVQGKLIVNAPGDKYEREADRIAEQVMRMPAPPRAELAEDQQQEAKVQPAIQRSGDGAVASGGEFAQQLNAGRGRGQPLPSALKTEFEAKFGADFSGVTIHADAQADGLSHSIQAEAFTQGRDIYVGGGQYAPNSMEGKRLLAHELTHVVQQNGQGSPKVRGNHGGLVISRLDNAVTIQRKLDTSKYKKMPNKNLGHAIQQYNESQIKKVKVETGTKEYDEAQMVELEALQLIEALTSEWLAKSGTLKTESASKLISELIVDVMREITTPDMQKAERVQYRHRTEDTQVSHGNQGFYQGKKSKKRKLKPFEYVTKEGLKATNPFDYGKAEEAATKAEEEAKQLTQAAEKEETNESKMAAKNAKATAEEARKTATEAKLRATEVQKSAAAYELNPEELFAIRLYTAGDYTYINPILVNDMEFLERSLKRWAPKGRQRSRRHGQMKIPKTRLARRRRTRAAT